MLTLCWGTYFFFMSAKRGKSNCRPIPGGDIFVAFLPLNRQTTGVVHPEQTRFGTGPSRRLAAAYCYGCRQLRSSAAARATRRSGLAWQISWLSDTEPAVLQVGQLMSSGVRRPRTRPRNPACQGIPQRRHSVHLHRGPSRTAGRSSRPVTTATSSGTGSSPSRRAT